MTGPAVRSRLHALRLERQAARLGRELLDHKREAILRALLDHTRRRERAKAALDAQYARATSALRDARIMVGGRAADAAELAQPSAAAVDWRAGSVVGVPTPKLTARVPAFVPFYGPAAAGEHLDRAGAEYSKLIASLIAFAEEDEAVRNLQRGLSKTVRRLKALEEIVLPRLEREAKAVSGAIEEDERDDTVRSRRAAEAGRHSPPAGSESPEVASG
jgi:V/A-type H+-transporting ATPase subunit D